jgi:putative transposase
MHCLMVWISSASAHPDSAWVAQQARNMCMELGEEKQMPTDLIHDADTKFTTQFDEIFKAEGIRVKRLLPRCPNMNAYVERFVQTLEQECLDHFVILGEKHLNHVVSEFLAHYHAERPHQGIENVHIMAKPLPVHNPKPNRRKESAERAPRESPVNVAQ